jgi:hypothetical protein
MTLPDERYRAVMQTAKFLESLSYSSETKRVPLAIRQEARRLLRHYPNEWDMQVAAESSPNVFQERMEEVTRLFKQYEQSKAEKNET